MSEVSVLGNPFIRDHPNIVDLEGITWELDNENLIPVFVFQKAQLGSLDHYLRSEGRMSSLEDRLKICLDVGKAIAALHSTSMCSRDRNLAEF